MTLTCPHCGFSREVDDARLPAQTLRVTCPRCRMSFPLERRAGATPETAPADLGRPTETAAADLPPELLPKAGFWVRVVAAALDGAAVGLLQGVLGSLLAAVAGIEPGVYSSEALVMMFVLGLFGAVLGLAYRVAFLGACGQTPGKMAVKVKVIRTDGGEVGYGRAFQREFLGKLLSKLLLGFGYLMVAFDAQKQGLHDRIAGTYVIRL
jgi:predicted Zn finger-like uncharacterized protein